MARFFGSVTEDDAIEFFDDHPELTTAGQQYHRLSRADKFKAYKTLKQIDDRVVGSGSVSAEAVQIVSNLQKLQQYKKGLGSKPAIKKKARWKHYCSRPLFKQSTNLLRDFN